MDLQAERGWGLDTQSLRDHRWLVGKWYLLLRALYSKAVNNLMSLLTYGRTFLSGDYRPSPPGVNSWSQRHMLPKMMSVTSSPETISLTLGSPEAVIKVSEAAGVSFKAQPPLQVYVVAGRVGFLQCGSFLLSTVAL